MCRRFALGGVLDVKKMGRALSLSRTGELFPGVEKWVSGFHYSRSKETGTPLFYTRDGTLRLFYTAKKPIIINAPQKYVVFWGVFGHFPKISKFPYAKKYYRYGLLLRGQERGSYVL